MKLVSVILCVYNGSEYICESIDSILNQTYSNIEFIIVDDASTDDTKNKIKQYDDRRIVLLELCSNVGLAAALNLGIANSHGEYLARQDADDISLPTRIAETVAKLDAYPDTEVVGCQVKTIGHKGTLRLSTRSFRPCSNQVIYWSMLLGTPFTHGSVVFRANSIRALGGYDECFKSQQDIELWSRLITSRNSCNLSKSLMLYRVHSDTITHRDILNNSKHRRIQYKKILEKICESRGLTNTVWPKIWAEIMCNSSTLSPIDVFLKEYRTIVNYSLAKLVGSNCNEFRAYAVKRLFFAVKIYKLNKNAKIAPIVPLAWKIDKMQTIISSIVLIGSLSCIYLKHKSENANL